MTPQWQSKSDMVADAIRELIDDGTFGPGELLRQRDLAQRFGISPTPVREALHRLEAEGYVESKLHHGATVVRRRQDRLSENFLIRAALEGLAAELATKKITEECIDEIERLNEQIATLEGDVERRLALNRELHFRLYAAAESPVLESLLTLLWDSLEHGPGQGRPVAEAVSEHRAIIDALRARDSRAASRSIRQHITDGLPYEATSEGED